jgi:subtilisin family serine protease
MSHKTDKIRRTLAKTLIGEPLAGKLRAQKGGESFDVIIDPNLDYPTGREAARRRIAQLIGEAVQPGDPDPCLRPDPHAGIDPAHPYLFATLTAHAIHSVVENAASSIYRIWEDTEIEALLTRSLATVKADAAQKAFAAEGDGIVWAVIDSGIDATHPHFQGNQNLCVPAPLQHRDFTGANPEAPLIDGAGHGSHVAGIIAGAGAPGQMPRALIHKQDETTGKTVSTIRELDREIRGMAPRARLLSLKVLDSAGKGKTSAVIEAIAAIQKFNDFGRRIIVHGVNLSAGYAFMPEWFACGQSPLCVEVNRLVRSGVVVVVAAGNSGYGSIDPDSGPLLTGGLTLTINDPGNAEDAITVGSTHREMPHTYGVSYFSSKGPTGDGRLKPDLVAPGECILSCAAGDSKVKAAAGLPRDQNFDYGDQNFDYIEDSGTSMAAPHVSGAIAAFLSVRREFIGRPSEVKQLFMANATDLKRNRAFQGSGLLDLMRVIQAV